MKCLLLYLQIIRLQSNVVNMVTIRLHRNCISLSICNCISRQLIWPISIFKGTNPPSADTKSSAQWGFGQFLCNLLSHHFDYITLQSDDLLWNTNSNTVSKDATLVATLTTLLCLEIQMKYKYSFYATSLVTTLTLNVLSFQNTSETTYISLFACCADFGKTILI